MKIGQTSNNNEKFTEKNHGNRKMNQNLQSKSKKCQKWIEVNTYNIAILKNHTNLHTLLPSIVNYFAQIFIMTITYLFWLKLVIR